MPRHTGIHPENRNGTGVDPLAVQNLMLKITQPGYSKRVKLDDKDADEEDDGKALADEGYSYIRELEYQDGLEEEEEDDEETQPAKKCVNLGDEDSDEEDDEEDQPAKELEEKDADEEDDEEVQPAASAQLAKLEDRRIHLMQVRKAAEAREARRPDNETGMLRPTFRTGDKYPKARIEHRRAGDERLLRYYRKHDTFAGAEVYIKPNVCTDPRANCHVGIVGGASSNADDYYKVDIRRPAFMSVDQYPKAQIEHGRDGDDLLARYYCKHNTFAGAYVYIKPNGDPEPVIET